RRTPGRGRERRPSMTMPRTLSILLAAAALAVPALAQAPPAPPDHIAQNVFPPELVMKHGAAISLDDQQRAGMKEAITKAQGRMLDVQWDMQAESEKLVHLLQARPVDEAAVLAQADKVLGLEREVKKAQLS